MHRRTLFSLLPIGLFGLLIKQEPLSILGYISVPIYSSVRLYKGTLQPNGNNHYEIVETQPQKKRPNVMKLGANSLQLNS